MTTSTSKSTKASVAAKSASLVTASFGSNGQFIRYNLKLATPALKKEFPGYEDVRITAYIGGHMFIQPGTTRDDTVAPIVKKSADSKVWLAKHNLQDITNNHTFGISRQIVGQKSKNPAKAAELTAEFNSSRATIG